MNRDGEYAFDSRIAPALIIVTTLLSVVISLLSLSSGLYIIFQNLFYIPIILACIFYLRRGLIFSIILSFSYFVLLMAFAGIGELENGIVRTFIFIAIASLVTVLIERIKETEKKVEEKNNELDKANEELKKSRDRYHMLFESTGDGIFLHEIDQKNGSPGRFLEVNSSACESLGYTRDELRRLTVFNIIPDNSKEETKEHIEALYRKGDHTFESSHLRADGTIFPVEVNAHLIKNDNNSDYILSVARDITRRKEAEEALRRSEEQYRVIYDNSPIAIELYDKDGYLIHANPSCLKLLGVENTDLLKNFFIFGDPHIGDEQKKMLAEGEIVRYESEFDFEKVRDLNLYPTSRKGTIWLNVLITPLKTPTNSISGYLVQVQDITDRKLIAEELRISEMRYRDLADNAPIGILTCDRNGKITYVNNKVPRMLGSPSIEKTMEINLLQTENIIKSRLADTLRNVIESGADYPEFEIEYTSVWGKKLYLRLHISPVLNGDTPEGARVIIDDITRRREAEEAIKMSEGQLRTFIQTIPDLIWLKDENGVYLVCNPEFEHLFGAKESEIKGKTDYDFLEKKQADFFREKDRQAVEAGKPTVNDEWITFADDGRLVYLETIKTPVYDSNGNVTGVLGIGRDITERKKSEDALKEANRKLNLLSSITRHDILNQITGAAGYLGLIEMDKLVPPGTKAEDYIKRISGAIETIKRQITFTGYYKDLGEQAPGWFDAGDLVNKVSKTSSFGDIEHKNNIKNVEIFADPLFEKVIYNLIDNAIKHGETITEISFYTLKTPEELIIVCEDNGVGIPAGVKEKIFRREYYKNSGLGLFLSREILAITGLTIEETGTPGKGARFEIHVPKGKFRINSEL
ncbi:PAS domain S-box protein [Methanolacinia paynteri]|uniref:PAS domain S-box protein n=1 Tax=Methanolacinia paynteri TaxID=230356 RepID=UPI0006938896|nr:PAS domain S-box protein [Methanolacinia paynteri]